MVIFPLHPLDVIYNGHTTSDAYYARSDEQRDCLVINSWGKGRWFSAGVWDTLMNDSQVDRYDML